jgi:hypothetical protein
MVNERSGSSPGTLVGLASSCYSITTTMNSSSIMNGGGAYKMIEIKKVENELCLFNILHCPKNRADV